MTELLAIPECREVVMVTRKPTAARSRVRNVVFDTGASDFAERTAALAREVLTQGPASAVSCVGVGSGSRRWSEEDLKRLELGVVGAFARGCHDANRSVLPTFSDRKHSPQPVSVCPRNGYEGRHSAQHRFYPPRRLSPRHHCRQRSHPCLSWFVAKTRARAVWQYRPANSRSVNRRGNRFAQPGGR